VQHDVEPGVEEGGDVVVVLGADHVDHRHAVGSGDDGPGVAAVDHHDLDRGVACEERGHSPVDVGGVGVGRQGSGE
jgi:hypothetical protein